MNAGLASRGKTGMSDETETPPGLYGALDCEFGFDLDPCASDKNALATKYFTIQDDGLRQPWGGLHAFVNPPYSQVDLWVSKALDEIGLSVLLLPVRTSTDWWQRLRWSVRTEFRFLRKRVHFLRDGAPILNPKTGKESSPFFDSVIVVVRPKGGEGHC